MLPRLRKPGQWAAVMLLALVVAGCAPKQTAVGVGSLPPVVRVAEWPFWLDVPIVETDYERLWRTTLDIVTERHAIGTMDKESGYVRTEWRPSADRSSESRYTLRIRPTESRIRMGIEVRLLSDLSYPTVLYNRPDTPWTSVYNELRQRLSGL
jgi:hypothetical protein